MAQTNYTPISLYYSTTASAVPTAANLVQGELAINTADGKLYYEDSSGVVQVLATKSTGSIGGSNTQVQFNNSGSLGGSSSFTWDGTTVTATKFAGALNGTVGATTASTGAFTTINASTSITNAALTSGRVTYAGASGLLSDSANLVWDNTNARLGIGTSSPIAPLQIGNYGVTNGEIALASTTTGYGTILFGDGASGSDYYRGFVQYNHSSDAMVFATSTLERMFINSAGIVTMNVYGAGAATFSASGVISSVSDETWKTKDGVPTNTDAMLQKLEPGYWFYNEEKAPIFGEDRQLGFYAQNVHEAIGAEAAPTPEEGKPWGYYDRSVLAVAVMSLKNALNTIEELKQRITVLENK